ncbi:hypothetical protein [Viscerimonas tarda]
MTRGFIWLPSFSKEVFSDIINEYQLKLFDESESNIAFENEYIYWGMHIDDYFFVRSGFYFDKKDTQKRLDITQLLEYESIEIKKYYYSKMKAILAGEYYMHQEEIIKSQILLFHEIIESYFLSFFEGEIPDYWEQAIKLPRYDYFKLLGNEFGNE